MESFERVDFPEQPEGPGLAIRFTTATNTAEQIRDC
jgi:hypothetical protein